MSFFEPIELMPDDPILSLPIVFGADPRTTKVNLGIGAYKDSEGKSLILTSVRKAEAILLKRNLNKDYLPIEGDRDFITESLKLVFGAASPLITSGTVFGAQTIGGTGALRIGGEFLAQQISKTIYLSNPTWPNHKAIFNRAGLKIESYPYYDHLHHRLDFPAMYQALNALPSGSIVLLQASCHNPTGMDLAMEQWQEISKLVKKQKIIPFFDFAYQGFAQSIDEDAKGVRYFAEEGHEMLVATSYAKNFGIYGERAGFLAVVSKNKEAANKVGSQIKQIIRGSYSTPPLHSARIVTTILKDPELKKEWLDELDNMRGRVNEMRKALIGELLLRFKDKDFSFLNQQRGLFSFCGLDNGQVHKLREEKGIYMPSNGRMNVAGLNWHNLEYVVNAIVSVLKE